MTIPRFSAEASLYRTRNRYHLSSSDFEGPGEHTIVPAYLPGPQTRERCSGCTDVCVAVKDVCLAKVAVMVTQACWGSLGFGCGAAIAWGYMQSGGCYASYSACFGLCQIPSFSEVGWKSPCCPKVCGIHTPGSAGSGCCDHGEACVGSHNPNTRDGCCPVGQECHGNCCAKGEHCLEGGICSSHPGYFDDTYPPPPPPPVNNCLFGGEPCGRKCCVGDEVCCYDAALGGPICKLHTCVK
jgi:hypothetical protein